MPIYVTYNMKNGLLSAAHELSASVAGVDFDAIKGDGEPYRLSVTTATDALAAIIVRVSEEVTATPGALQNPNIWNEALAAIEIGELMDGRLGTPEEAKASVGDAGSFRGDYIGDIDGLAGHSADVIVTTEGTEAKFTGTGTGYDNTWTEFPDSAFIPSGRTHQQEDGAANMGGRD